ncbi:HIR complex subunit [Elasticomyces elasticus]|nr:HIR complex subunit [Elasticomyces elasticus]
MAVEERSAHGGLSPGQSSPLSTPTGSPQRNDTIVLAAPHSRGRVSQPGLPTPQQPVSANSAYTITNADAAAFAKNGNVATATTDKVKQPRKKKEPAPAGSDDKPKEKKVRKAREPRKDGAPVQRNVKRQKVDVPPVTHNDTKRQPTINELVGQFQTPMPVPAKPQHNGQEHVLQSNSLGLPSNPPTPRPASSGQIYDPIRSTTLQTTRNHATALPPTMTASPRLHRASASPAIASLIDPPTHTYAVASPPHPQAQTTEPRPASVTSTPNTTRGTEMTLATNAAVFASATSASASTGRRSPTSADGMMDMDPPVTCEMPPPAATKEPQEFTVTVSKTSSSTATPKIARPTPPLLPSGSGLLSNDMFSGSNAANGTEGRLGVNIDVRIPLNPQGGNTINIAQEITKKYGRDAINPRAAAHRLRLLQVAAAANKLELGSSADEMSLDLLSEADADSNVEMGGIDDRDRYTAAGLLRQRKKKVEDYDKEDDFIDDTELAWQQGQAVAKDGFFVFSGPLVQEGEKVNIERYDGTTPTSWNALVEAPRHALPDVPKTKTIQARGRARSLHQFANTSIHSTNGTTKSTRGRGRGKSRAAAAAGVTHASLAATADGTSALTTSTRGKGTGRGRGGAARKPRITKADKERMEAEKVDRQRAGVVMVMPTVQVSGTTA